MRLDLISSIRFALDGEPQIKHDLYKIFYDSIANNTRIIFLIRCQRHLELEISPLRGKHDRRSPPLNRTSGQYKKLIKPIRRSTEISCSRYLTQNLLILLKIY